MRTRLSRALGNLSIASILLLAFPSALAARMNVEQQVLDTDQAWVDAETGRDRPALDRILDDKFVATFDAGRPLDKARFLKTFLDDDMDTSKTQKLSDRHVVVDRDTAALIETDTISGTDAGRAYAMTGRLTAIYVRRAGT